ncbi:MAG: hypothetical protein AAGC60_12895 [Acidobacteriota bacterium]
MITDRDTLICSLDRALDGDELSADERSLLDAALADDASLRREREHLESLHAALAADTVQVRAGFSEQVVAALPTPAWHPRARRGDAAWRLPLAALLACALGAALLLVGLPTGDGLGATLADFAQSTLLAGAGLLGASWRGLGYGLRELFAASSGTLIATAVAVLCLDLLFLSLLRRRPRAAARSSAESDGGDR